MMFESGKLPPSYDVFRCVVNIPEDVQRVGEPAECGEQVSKIRSASVNSCTKYFVDSFIEVELLGKWKNSIENEKIYPIWEDIIYGEQNRKIG